ncbi:N-formylglutamate deformylase [Caulobacter sp. Root1455]|uniref:N-formylglutamate deformylase n=1 Tax=Caulobacter sp. Root1455 TaxID=1736465 RepID=UPI0006FE54F0|nr:N-formylglutamate deformylase [Caulobacter sp. Root1455]KQY95364.1 N-formylglutamate deformylase [Caulobacter sp. Root1455]
MSPQNWLHVTRGEAPLVVSIPHAGTIIPSDIEARLVSPWLARKDADWWLGELYAFADGLDAAVVRTGVSRTVIDVNRDPSGVSLYPGQATTSLCPVDTFDGEPLYVAGQEPGAAEIARRRVTFFDPYHAALETELDRLVAVHGKVVLYDAHSIRSRAPRLFDGELPQFNIGTNGGAACDPGLTRRVEAACDATGLPRVTNGRFKGGWITRRYGRPDQGVHAVQMELACRGYIDEPAALTPASWPTPYHAPRAAPLRAALTDVLKACIAFAQAAVN